MPRATIVIPSLDGDRDGCVPRLLETLKSQTFQDYSLQMVIGVSPQGRAINQGASRGDEKYIIILDDDSTLADPTVLERLVDSIEKDPGIGMAGASIILPPGASAFQRRAAGQFPRFNTPLVDRVTDSDFACHGCCAIPRKVFEEVGGEREDLLRGLDPDLRVRIRAAGYRVVLVPGAAIHHPLPDGWRNLLRIFFRNGYGSAYARKYQPEAVYETHESLDSERFVVRRSLPYRVLRYPLRLARALALGQFQRFGAYWAYALGYVWGQVGARPIASPSQDPPSR